MKTSIKNAKTFIILSIIAGLCFSACKGPGSAAPDAEKTGALSGHAYFRDSDSHAGINITLEKTDGLYSQAVLSAARNLAGGAGAARAVAENTTTGVDGSYSFPAIAPGIYTVYASSPNSMEKAVAVNVQVEAGRAVTAGDLNLTPAGSVSGRISLDNAATGNYGFLVCVAGTSYLAVTADNGSFTISDIPAGSGYLIIIIKGNYTDLWADTPVTVKGGETTALSPDPRPVTSAETSGTGGLVWKGEMAAAPAYPQTNWAYYNTVEKTSYIWNGTKWDTLAAQGGPGDKGDPGEDASSGEIIEAVKQAIEQAKATAGANDGSEPEKAFTVGFAGTGLDLDDENAMRAVFNGVKDLYVHLDLSGASGNAYHFYPLSMYIGKWNILSVTLGDSVEVIEDGANDEFTGAFYGFYFLNTISAPGVKKIGQNAFNGCFSLESVNLPAAESINWYAFSGCRSLESVNMPAVESMEGSVFFGCQSLESVSFPVLKSIEWGTFQDCDSLTSITIAANCMFLNMTLAPGNFDDYYNTTAGKAAGVYTYNGTSWSWGPMP